MNYQRNKALARSHRTQPTETDQSQIHETDRNIIVQRYLVHGQAPGARKQPLYADFSQLPSSLGGFLAQARDLEKLRKKLPKELANMTMQQLMSIDARELARILTPPDPPAPEAPKEPPKEPANKEEKK